MMRTDIERFLEREERQRANGTMSNRRSGLSRYDEWLTMEPAAVGMLDFEDFVTWLTSTCGVSDRTAYNYLTQVWRFHQYLVKREVDATVPDKEAIVSAVGLNLTESERDKHISKDQCSLTPEQMRILIDHAPDPAFKNGLVMKLMGATGIRPKDLRDLKCRDVDDDYRWLHVRSSKTHSRRKIPIPDSLAQTLRLWFDHGYRDGCTYAEQSDHLIPGQQSERLGQSTIEDIVTDAAEAAGMQETIYEDANGHARHKITAYSFRYGYGNHMKNEIDPERLQTLMGHKSVTTTLEFYNTASEEEIAETAGIAPDP